MQVHLLDTPASKEQSDNKRNEKYFSYQFYQSLVNVVLYSDFQTVEQTSALWTHIPTSAVVAAYDCKEHN